jgi:hypothetical protein
MNATVNIAGLVDYIQTTLDDFVKRKLFELNSNERFDLRLFLKDWTQDQLLDYLITQGYPDYRIHKKKGELLEWNIVVNERSLDCYIKPNYTIDFINLDVHLTANGEVVSK